MSKRKTLIPSDKTAAENSQVSVRAKKTATARKREIIATERFKKLLKKNAGKLSFELF